MNKATLGPGFWCGNLHRGDAVHWNREQKRGNEGGVEWEGIDYVFSFVCDTFELLILYIEISSMQLDIRAKIQEEDIG